MKKVFLFLFVIIVATLLFSTASANIFNDDIAMDSTEIAQIAGPYASRVCKAARWKDGMVAILDNDQIAYFIAEQDEPVMVWEHPTYDYDFFFSTTVAWPDAEYDLCVVFGDREVYSFRNNLSMAFEIGDLTYFGFDENFAYFFSNQEGRLFFWSPYAKVPIVCDDAQDVIVEADYVFFNDRNGGHVIDASVEAMNRHNQFYFIYHPLRIVDFGDDFWNHCGLYEHSEEFDREYGLDFTRWGYPKTEIKLSEFVYYTDRSYSAITEDFDLSAKEFDNPAIHDGVSFCGHDGYLLVFCMGFNNVKRLCWVSHSGSAELTAELREIVAAECTPTDSNVRFNDDVIEEYAYSLQGNIIHVGLTIYEGETISYVYKTHDNE